MESDVADPQRDGSRRSVSVALAGAALASAGAGLVHAAAAWGHSGDRTVTALFAVAAAAQLMWAALAVARPGRVVAAAGAWINLALVTAWVLSRTTGLPLVDSLTTREIIGLQDAVAATLASVAVAGAAWHWSGRPVPAVTRHSPALAGALVATLALAVPGMVAPHPHDGTADHQHPVDPSDAPDAALASDARGAGNPHDAGDGHPHEAAGSDGPIISIDDPRLTAEQRSAARELIAETRRAMAAFPDIASIEAAGYVSIGDGVTGYEHFIKLAHVGSPETLDPDAIESIVVEVDEDGTRTPVSAMYIAGPGTTLADVPDVAGELTTWHDHQDLCWEGVQVVAVLDDAGTCPRGTLRATPPMLHVWMTEHPCGPFAGIEGSHGSGCGHDDH